MLSVFWLLREKLSLAGGFGCTSVAVNSFVFFYKKLVMRTHAAYSAYCFTYHVQFCVLHSRQCQVVNIKKQGHTKTIFVKDFQCKIERYIPLYKIGLPMRCLALPP